MPVGKESGADFIGNRVVCQHDNGSVGAVGFRARFETVLSGKCVGSLEGSLN